MSKISLEGNASGSGTLTISAPNTNSNFTLSLPTNTGTIITQNSTPAFASTIGVGGATAAASGAGITFPATQSASSDANTLDDYEEGTWTPGVSGLTFNAVYGMYRKIGSCVYVYGDCNNSNTSALNPAITGLPFTSTNSASTQYGGYFFIPEPAGWTLSAGYTYLYYRVDKNSTSGLFLQGDGRNHTSGVTIGSNANFRFSGFYFTD